MKVKNLTIHTYQSILGILVEIAYSLAIMLSAAGIIYLIQILKWSLGRL